MSRPATSASYLKTQVLTASPGELMVLLYNAAINFAERARARMHERKFDESHELIVRVENIIMELSNGLRKDVYPDLVANLARLYEFAFTRLFEANCHQDAARLDEVVQVLTVLRDGWVEALHKEAPASTPAAERVPAPAGLELSA